MLLSKGLFLFPTCVFRPGPMDCVPVWSSFGSWGTFVHVSPPGPHLEAGWVFIVICYTAISAIRKWLWNMLTGVTRNILICSWLSSFMLLSLRSMHLFQTLTFGIFFLKPLELLCEKAIGTGNRPMGAGEALRRVLECLASGILMAGNWIFHLP